MEIVALIIIISFLAIILFVALRKLINSITEESKEYYFKKIQDYDALIAEKEAQLSSLGTNISESKSIKNKKEIENKVDRELLKILNQTDYLDFNALKMAKNIDNIFKIDEEKIIKEFLKAVDFSNNHDIYQSLIDRFSPNMIYNLKTQNNIDQIESLKKILSDDEYKVFQMYVDNHKKFDLKKFIIYLKDMLNENPSYIEVLVGERDKSYDDLSPYIKTIYSEDIYKGIIIKYQNRIYDYSINERDV